MPSPHYLNAMSRFHNYSFGNVLEIARQMPDATRVAGFWTWKNLGRSVKAGRERHPHPCSHRRRSPQEGRGSREGHHQAERRALLLGFRNAYVFDVSQTDGADLPELREVSGDAGENRDRLAAFIERQGIELVYNREHCSRAWHELRRTHRHPARTVEGRGVFNACA